MSEPPRYGQIGAEYKAKVSHFLKVRVAFLY